MNLKHLLIISLVGTLSAQIITPAPTQDQLRAPIPLGIKNFSHGRLHGICANIAAFQALCAGLRLIDDTSLSILKESSNATHPFLPVAKRYFSQMDKEGSTPFIFDQNELDENTDCFTSWLTKDSGYMQVCNYYSHNQHINVSQKNIENYIASILPSYTKPPIIAMRLKSQAFDAINDMSTLESSMQGRPWNICSSCTIKIDNEKTVQYQLVGVVQKHNYLLVPNKGYNIRKLLAYLFRIPFDKSPLVAKITTILPPSKIIAGMFNTAWETHFDAYVNYDNRWYIMDDETRWEVSATQTTNNVTQAADDVAQALIQCYPGVPALLVYAPVETDVDMKKSSGVPTENTQYTLHLTRQTPAPAKHTALMSLLGCGLADGLFGFDLLFITATGLKKLLSCDIASNKIMLGLTGLFSCASIAYHARHMLPMYQSKRAYYADSADPGPRSPLL